jgi:pyrimidine-nucleoside phosphorylase
MKSATSLLPLIEKKRLKASLSADEISFFVRSLTSKSPPPDYQISSLLAFIVCHGMTREEISSLTQAMMNSGQIFQYPGFPKDAFFVDKHSTGGVGDKITLPLASWVIAATENVYIPTIAGRGLGHTGGTVDKLESIPGFKTPKDIASMRRLLKKNRLCFMAQTPKIVPADQILYALRDVSGTVASVPLITASILSKKLSESLQYLLIDLKVGTGAFLTQPHEAEDLSETMLQVLKDAQVQASLWMTDMNSPLGSFSGNRLEVEESLAILRGDEASLSTELTFQFATEILKAAGFSQTEAESRLQKSLSNGKALEVFQKIVEAQGGSWTRYEKARRSARVKKFVLKADRDGYVDYNVRELGWVIVDLGGGRKTKLDKIHPDVGLYHPLTRGRQVHKGDEILTLHYASTPTLTLAKQRLPRAVWISEKPLELSPLVAKVKRV